MALSVRPQRAECGRSGEAGKHAPKPFPWEAEDHRNKFHPIFQIDAPPNSDTRSPVPWLTLTTSDVRNWHANIEQHASAGVNKILLGNKCDWDEKRAVKIEDGRALADEFGLRFLETSAKANEGVEQAFYTIARYVFSRVALQEHAHPFPVTGAWEREAGRGDSGVVWKSGLGTSQREGKTG
jgi:Ras-related protein Rab-8A